jgi:hypothetical protein
MNRIYRIRFDKSSYDLDRDYERFSEHEKVSISSMNPDSFFDFNDAEGRYTIYLIFSPIDLKKYLSILENNLISCDLADLSDALLQGSCCVESEARPYISSLNRFRWNSYKSKLEQWIYDSLDIDLVLDRISACGGVDGLRPVEKKFLRNYQSQNQ